ncbi:MAG: SDR family NAD(P)-dependent oxidoreductase [Anaerolineales bacterium]|nr:SDR family NAD(P)-dependent oxidoreductase [Anaerolineales bacterium]
MARIFITGSTDGLGRLAAERLIQLGHRVILHARDQRRAEAVWDSARAEAIVTGDLASLDETQELAAEVNALGRCNAVIHNAGIYQDASRAILRVNTLAPYLLTALIHPPRRLIYLSSDMHWQGRPVLEAVRAGRKISYSDSKLHDLLLAKAVARRRPTVYANAVDPGWVPTKMGGPSASDDLRQGFETQAWLAVSGEAGARVSGGYFYHGRAAEYLPAADDVALQEDFLAACEEATGVRLPGSAAGGAEAGSLRN